jgi:hypothetical protein
MSARQTPAFGEDVAIDRLRDSGPSVALILPSDVAERLLAERGWEPQPVGAWLSPNGWVASRLADALWVALVAENS